MYNNTKRKHYEALIMKINRERFYQAYREYFGDIKTNKSVEAINALLNTFEISELKIKAVEKWAYMLATVRHECGPAMLPITENLNYSAKRLMQVWPSRFPTTERAKQYAYNPQKLGNHVYGLRLGNGQLEGFKYRGRGFIQITGYDNYKKFGIEQDPDKALDVEIGASILYSGMIKGLFTGRKLAGSITGNKTDYYNARGVVNADKKRVGRQIASDAVKFEGILKYSLT